MNLSEKNGIRVFSNNATASTVDESIGVYSIDSAWINSDKRKLGALGGKISESVVFNTALRQATFMSTILAEVFVNRFNLTSEEGLAFGTDVGEGSTPEERAAWWAQKFNTVNFLQTSEVTTEKIKDLAVTESKLAVDSVTNTKIKNGSVTADKIADDVVKNSMTVGTSKTSWSFKYVTNIEDVPETIPDGQLYLYINTEYPSTIKTGVLYIII